MLESAWKEELLAENRAKRIEVPEIHETKTRRAVLTDAEIGLLLGHPHVDAELKLLILMSRTIGGMRSGDLNTLMWDAFDPEFASCTFVRRKTRKKNPAPQSLEVPEAVRSFIEAWWDVSKQPTSGPVFPVRRGERAGQVKAQSKQSYADRLRRNLRVAFGLDAWNALTRRFDRVTDREPTPRERELLDGGATARTSTRIRQRWQRTELSQSG